MLSHLPQVRLRRGRLRYLVASVLVMCACGSGTDNLASDPADAGWVDFSDADPNAPDAAPSAGCRPDGPQCSNCVDDDMDGFTDGFDPECTGSLDDREDSFATGISGDNKDEKKQDCFFDGNSGGGDDKCSVHTCCLLDGPCPAELNTPPFDPNDCAPSQSCIDNCMPLTPPGCDCFGCCTICDDAGCETVFTNPAVAPDCTRDTLRDPAKCPSCTPVEACENDCTELECQLCPGQDPGDLPDTCMGTECGGGLRPCVDQTDCLDNEFCAQGCCIRAID